MESLYKIPSKSCSNKKRQVFWSQVMADQIASGISMIKFCQLHGLKYTTFKSHRYSRKNIKKHSDLYNDNKLKSKQNKNANENGIDKFIPLQIVTDKSENKLSDMTIKEDVIDKSADEINIVFKNGHKVILPPVVVEKDNLLQLIKTVAGL